MGALLDAHALVAFLRGEPGGAAVREILRDGDVAIPAINLAEALDAVIRGSGVEEDSLRGVLQPLQIAVVPLTEGTAWRAAVLRARHYRKRVSELSIADCCLLASATPADVVVTGDKPILRMAAAEGVRTVELAIA